MLLGIRYTYRDSTIRSGTPSSPLLHEHVVEDRSYDHAEEYEP